MNVEVSRQSRLAMRSARSVKRPHTNHHGKNTRRNRGKLIKNARMRRKQWAHTLIYSPDVAAKKQAFNLHISSVNEVNHEDHNRRTEKKKEKKLLAKQNIIEIRRLEHERKEKEKEGRRIKRDEEKKRRKVLEYQKMQEVQKKEMRVQKESVEKQVSQRRVAEVEARKELEVQVSQRRVAEVEARKELESTNKEKEIGNKDKKSIEGEKNVTKATVSVEKSSPIDKRSAPLSNLEEEVEKKKQRMGEEATNEKDAAKKMGGIEFPTTTDEVAMCEEEEQAKKKGSKSKKMSETDSGFHNADHSTVPTSEVPYVEEHSEINEKTNGENGQYETTAFVNGDMARTAAEEPMFVIESAPIADVPIGDPLQVDGRKKSKKNKVGGCEAIPDSSIDNKGVSKDECKSGETGIDPKSHYDDEDRTEDENSLGKKKHVERNGLHDLLTENDETIGLTKSQDVHIRVIDVIKSPTPTHINELTAHIKEVKGSTDRTTKSTSPTQFAQNVEKLVEHVNTKMKHNINEIDPSVKKKSDIAVDHKFHITPLPLDHQFSRPATPSRERLYKLLPKDIIFCSGLIDSYGEDYAAMAADPRNVYKENVRGIQRKIRIFKESPHYQTYIRAKQEGRPIEDILAEEDQT